MTQFTLIDFTRSMFKSSINRFHHRATKVLYSNHNHRVSPIIRIFLLLIESGALFCNIQVGNPNFTIGASPYSSFSMVCQLFYAIFALVEFEYQAVMNSMVNTVFSLMGPFFDGIVVSFA